MAGRRRRARREPLSQDRIAAAALELLDERGIALTTMRAVAKRLGVEAMSLYRYFENRDRMLDAVVDRVVNELGDDPQVQEVPQTGWRNYLAAMAHGVRRYARAHPHAFPLVATRPADAPWINPPLRSVRWVELFLTNLLREGFTDAQALFAYRAFNTFLLGYLQLETSAMALSDPKPGDGSYDPRPDDGDNDPVSADAPVPGGLTPTRTTEERHDIDSADHPRQLINPGDNVDATEFPVIHRLAEGLAQDMWDAEFAAALENMLTRIEEFLREDG